MVWLERRSGWIKGPGDTHSPGDVDYAVRRRTDMGTVPNRWSAVKSRRRESRPSR
jgi:hypothetical protein